MSIYPFHSINLVAAMNPQAPCQAPGMWKSIKLLPYPIIYAHTNYPELWKTC